MIQVLIPGSGKRFISSALCSDQLWGPPLTGGSSVEVKWPGLDDRSPPFSATVKNDWSNTSTAPVGNHGMFRDRFTFITFISVCP